MDGQAELGVEGRVPSTFHKKANKNFKLNQHFCNS